MRVLDTWSGQFTEIDPKKKGVKYAILSHTWDPEGEQTYQALLKLQKQYQSRGRRWRRIAQRAATGLPSEAKRLWHQNRSSPTTAKQLPTASAPVSPPIPSRQLPLSPIWGDPELSPKVHEACRVARENGYRYLWIDSCCIDKTSSSELSESINSMYQWYALARVCYAFLPDVPAKEDHRRKKSRFRQSRWFTRGWTLQELIAPRDVQFLSTEWTFIGSKESLADLVVEVTNIRYNALLSLEPLDEFSVAERFSWAALRETTRVEDRAYSLLGIFDINMPTLYGEGNRAFRRLQEEIMRRTPDQSLFAWTELTTIGDSTSPLYDTDVKRKWTWLRKDSTSFLPLVCDAYKCCSGIEALSHEVARRLQLEPKDLPARRFEFTPYGICVQFLVISFSDFFPQIRDGPMDIPLSQRCLIILGCEQKDFPGHLLARICYTQSQGSGIDFLHSAWIEAPFDCDLLALPPATITRLRSSGGQISIKTLYVPQPERDQGARDFARRKRHDTIKLVLSEKTRGSLYARGYTTTLRSPDDARPRTHSVTLSHDTHTITIDYQHTLYDDDGRQRLTIEAHMKTSGPVLQDTSGDPLVLQSDDLQISSVLWQDTDDFGWEEELGSFQDVRLDIPGGSTAFKTVRLGLTLAKTNYYLLHIELKTADPVLAHAPVAEIQDALDGRPGS